MAKRLRITQVRSAISRPLVQRATLRSLGLRRLHRPVEQSDTPAIRGMIQSIRHLLQVEEIEG